MGVDVGDPGLLGGDARFDVAQALHDLRERCAAEGPLTSDASPFPARARRPALALLASGDGGQAAISRSTCATLTRQEAESQPWWGKQ